MTYTLPCGRSRRAARGSVPTSTPETSARRTIRLLRAPLQRKRAATAASESTTVASETEREHMMRAAYPLGGDFCGAALTAQLGWTAHNRRLPEVAPMSLPNRIGRGCCQHTIITISTVSAVALCDRWVADFGGSEALGTAFSHPRIFTMGFGHSGVVVELGARNAQIEYHNI